MEKKNSLMVLTPLIMAGKANLPPVRRMNLNWRDIVICMVVGVLSALISSYLTIERISPRALSNDTSQAARLAETMRDDWRKRYEESIKDRAELENTVAKLNAQIGRLAESLKQHETQLSTIQAQTPTYAGIKETIDHATRTNKGLQNEAVRILGDLGVSRVRVLD